MPKQNLSKYNQQKRLPKNEEKRLLELVKLEKKIAAKGFRLICGVDEAGRGPLAGPVVAAACILKKAHLFNGINDSKLLTSLKRKSLFETITTHPELLFGIGIVDADVIDKINILQATLLAMRKAVLALPEKPDYLLVDGNIGIEMKSIQVETIIKGDQRSQLIAASSIIAKEKRDELMAFYHQLYPQYGFNENKGYGTEAHRNALDKYGPCPIHRKTFSPVKNYV